MTSTWKDARLGYTVRRRPPTPNIDLGRFKDLYTSNISDILGKLMTMDCRIKPVVNIEAPVIGFAVTVMVHPGANLMVKKAMEMAQPGDIIVINDQFDRNNALLGGVMAEMAAAKGIAAFITDGLVRDQEELEAAGVPVFAQGLTPIAPASSRPMGQVNTAISCGGVIIHPGDIVMADKSGVVVIPAIDAETVLEKGEVLRKKEWEWLHPEMPGEFPIYASTNAELERTGCEIEPGA
ncbi:RraA family protein [Nitratireductor sp.]|uniref:RraA family protein n=1 Tax=Nitratireductor sp. TaxID=1872084 RepID=UPI002612C724|nr:RraA family protein [Nitratireductor sp.]MCV0378353.1 RraA family protein [Nitratireductor sp.]